MVSPASVASEASAAFPVSIFSAIRPFLSISFALSFQDMQPIAAAVADNIVDAVADSNRNWRHLVVYPYMSAIPSIVNRIMLMHLHQALNYDF